jgi:simple sugar transport system permease protein
VALLALNNPIGVIFAGLFMAMLNIIGLQLTNLTAYNEFITDVIIAVIVYLSAFSLVIRMFIMGRSKRAEPPKLGYEPAPKPAEDAPPKDAPPDDESAPDVPEIAEGGEDA